MNEQHPSFGDLVNVEELDAQERERLQAVHELLLEAGPPPDLSPALAAAPAVSAARVVPMSRRFRFTAVAAAAAAAVVLFGAGYLIGGRQSEAPAVAKTVAMSGKGGATATLAVEHEDAAGNWPMTLTVSGLEPLPEGATYELWLTRDGELAESCGSFAVSGEQTVVQLNAPYSPGDFTGWVVTTAADTGAFVLTTETT